MWPAFVSLASLPRGSMSENAIVGAGIQSARTLDVLDCVGDRFDPRWTLLRSAIDRFGVVSEDTLFELTARQLIIKPLPDLGYELWHIASELSEACIPDAMKFTSDWTNYFNHPDDDTYFDGAHNWWINLDAPDPPSFCLYGCAAAHFIMALTQFQALHAQFEKYREGSDELDNLEHLAWERLLFAGAMLGRGLALEVAPGSSAWRRASGAPNILCAKRAEWYVQRDTTAVSGGTPPTALTLARRLQPCDPVLQEGCWKKDAAQAELFVRARRSIQQSKGMGLLVTAIGEHAPLMDDVSKSVQAAAAGLGVMIDLLQVGAFYLCQGSRDGCHDDPTTQWLRNWVSRCDASDFQQSPSVEADGLYESLRANPDHRAAKPDLFLCLDHPIFCWLLRRRSTERAHLSSVPALHVLGMVLLMYVPQIWRADMLKDLKTWWGEMGELMTTSRTDIVAAVMETLVLQVKWQIGLAIPFVPTVGIAVRNFAAYDPPGADEVHTVIALRSAFWPLPGGRVFATLLERFVLANAATHRIRIHWMASFLSGSLSKREEQGTWLSYADMARNTCALYVPAELSQMKFRDMYSMGLPLLVPDGPWMLRVLKVMYGQWGQLQHEYADRLDERSVELFDWPEEPFYGMDLPESRLAYWIPLADHERYPHVVRFSSIPDFLDLVVSVAWNDLSVRMRAHFQRVLANVDNFYRTSLASLVAKSTDNQLR